MPQPADVTAAVDPDASEVANPWLHEVTADWGLDFTHEAARFDEYEMPAVMGSGGAVVDFDCDGWLDLYLVNGRPADVSSQADMTADRGDRLLRHVDQQRFEEVTASTGIVAAEFGMGAWWGDFDLDGFPDLLLTNVGANRLFHNQGDGTFVELPLPPDVAGQAWSTAACWADLNNDGLLDLFVVNYVDYLPGQYCDGADGRHEFCGPSAYPGTVDRLLINQGTFDGELLVDETVQRGLGDLRGKGLGTIARDFNGDGRTDLYVANDMESNRLWMQQPDGRFDDRAELLGLSRNFFGEMEASMGIVTGDWNDDGLPDLFMAHLAGETNTLYLSGGREIWQDATATVQLGPASLPSTGFGISAVDLEHDGDVDFLIANGGVKRNAHSSQCTPASACYAQHNAIFLQENANDASQSLTFLERSPLGGTFTSREEVSRAVASGDFDRDGDCDVLLTNCTGPARLYENIAPKKGHWLTLRLIDTIGNREAIGATVNVVVTSDRSIVREVNPYQGYLTQNELALHFGLGDADTYQSIEVTWPDGTTESFPAGPTDRRRTLVRGRGVLVAHAP